jgi:hypothetical protein
VGNQNEFGGYGWQLQKHFFGDELMSGRLQSVIAGLALCAFVVVGEHAANAGTIIKLTLGSVSPDVGYDGLSFSTVADGNPGTSGDQDTDVEFTDFLESEPDIISPPPASFTLSGLVPDGDAFLFNSSLILQNFTGGSFTLYAPDNSVLLAGTLADSSLTGSIGQTAGALFTTSFGNVTFTSLPNIDPDTLVLSMSLTSVTSTGGGGFAITGLTGAPPVQTGDLVGFTGDATVTIQAEFVPEPSSFALVAVGLAIGASRLRRS